MKKLTAMILALVMTISAISLAIAQSTGCIPFHMVSDDSSTWQTLTAPVTKHGDSWYLTINSSLSNISPTLRALVRVHSGLRPISATWVYYGSSISYHPYSANAQGTVTNVTLHGCLDARDAGTVEMHGLFCY